MEHYRPKGLCGITKGGYYQGYYCCRCGVPGLSMMGSHKHGSGICLSNPLIVEKLNAANTVEAEKKRQFVVGLKQGKSNPPLADWEYVVGGRKRKSKK